MAVFKTISSKEIIGRVYRDFKPETQNWVSDAFEWLFDVMADCSISPILQKGLVYNATIESHKAPMPACLRYIDGVEYNGYKLDYGGDISGFSLATEERTTAFSPKGIGQGTSVFQAKSGTLDPLGGNLVRISENTTLFNRGEYYQVNPDFITTSMETAEIKVLYSAFPTDDSGCVMIPDIVKFKQAAQWYIISMMMLGGWTHPNPKIDYQFADDKYWEYATIAKNKAKFPSFDQVDSFRKMWVRAIPDVNLPSQFFMNSEVQERIALNN